jgi:O-antigen/teichoic acid export membrane protein
MSYNKLTNGSLLVTNTLFNLLGQIAPLIVGILAIPVLIRQLGTERFGLLALAWSVIGYFSLLDLGLGRALTRLVAEKITAKLEWEIPSMAWTALFLMLLLGVVGTVILMLSSSWIIYKILKIPVDLQHETLNAFYVVAISIPVVTSTAGLRGILEAKQRFDMVNLVRFPLGILTFLGPLVVLPFSKDLFVILIVLLAGRILAGVAYLYLCIRCIPDLGREITLNTDKIRPLLSFGGWMTITNIISPIMMYFDRFAIGSLISITAVAYYTTPHEVVTKLLIIPAALAGVLFPAFAASFAQDRARTRQLFVKGIKFTYIALFPICLMITAFAHEGLSFWLSVEFANHSSRVLQLLAIGIFINALAHIPYAFVQGLGHPELTAKLHMVELPFYLVLLFALISLFNIEGAAIAWIIRVAFDCLILLVFSFKLLSETLSASLFKISIIPVIFALSLFFFVFIDGLIFKSVMFLVVFISFILYSWFVLLVHDKHLIKALNT